LVHAVRHGLSFVFLISAHRHEHETDSTLETNGIDAMVSDFIGPDPNAGLARPPVIDEWSKYHRPGNVSEPSAIN
jgi:hypothetical protein